MDTTYSACALYKRSLRLRPVNLEPENKRRDDQDEVRKRAILVGLRGFCREAGDHRFMYWDFRRVLCCGLPRGVCSGGYVNMPPSPRTHENL